MQCSLYSICHRSKACAMQNDAYLLLPTLSDQFCTCRIYISALFFVKEFFQINEVVSQRISLLLPIAPLTRVEALALLYLHSEVTITLLHLQLLKISKSSSTISSLDCGRVRSMSWQLWIMIAQVNLDDRLENSLCHAMCSQLPYSFTGEV